MAKPPKAALTKKGVHAGDVGKLQDLVVSDVIMPLDSKNPSEVSHVEGVEAFLLACIQGPRLAATTILIEASLGEE